MTLAGPERFKVALELLKIYLGSGTHVPATDIDLAMDGILSSLEKLEKVS
jgi:hypothetical protein